MREPAVPCWRDPRLAPYFRGARSLVYSLLRRDPYAGGQWHRLILLVCEGCRAASGVHAPPGVLQRPDAGAEERADGNPDSPADEGGLPCAETAFYALGAVPRSCERAETG